MPGSTSPEAVLQSIAELRQWSAAMADAAGATSDFAFKWAARNRGVPKTKAKMEKLLADYLARFPHQPDVADQQALHALEESYRAWAKERRIETATEADLERFDDETGLLTRRMDEVCGLVEPLDLARRIGERCDELSRAAVALGCDDATVAALKGAAALWPDIADGRAELSDPATHTEARRRANDIFQGEAIADIPLHRAWQVALDKLEHAARKRLEAGGAGQIGAASGKSVPPLGPQYRFRLSGNIWEIDFEGEHGQFADRKGFGIIAKLLRFPNPSKPMTAAGLLGRDTENGAAEHTQQPALDDEALIDYRNQIAEYDRDIEQAKESGDTPRAESLRRERQEVVDQLKIVNGLGSNIRPLGPASPAKSAQVAARAAVKRARKQIIKAMPKLAAHIDSSMSIGQECAYRPSNPPPSWQLD